MPSSREDHDNLCKIFQEPGAVAIDEDGKCEERCLT